MKYIREADMVRIEMSIAEWERLLLFLGMGAGMAAKVIRISRRTRSRRNTGARMTLVGPNLRTVPVGHAAEGAQQATADPLADYARGSNARSSPAYK